MRIKKNIAISETGFIFNPSTGESFSVNPIGVDIIKMLKEEKTKEDIKSFILKKFQTDEATFERDFYDFINIMNHYQITETHAEKKD